METVTANVSGRVRRVVRGGREYLVAPMTIIVPGVLPGSKGALYYPPEECAANARDWDETPIVVYHPTGPLGEPLSAAHPGVLDKQGVGVLRNTTFKGKLRAEGWFDVERTSSVDPRVLEALHKGQQMELSTGLFTTNEPAPTGAAHNGRPYEWVARKYKPDHLAILPDQVGACSLSDGCGLNVNTQGAPVSLLERLMGWLLQNAGPNQPRHGDTGTYLPHGAGTGKGEPHAAAKSGFTGTDTATLELEEPDALAEDDHSPEALMKKAEATYNRDWPQDNRDKLDTDDFAGPDQSYPITTQADVDSAAKLVGKAADPDAVKKRIIAIAKRKGLSLPDAWKEPTENTMPTSMPSDAHMASKQAAGASVMTENPKAREQALAAMDASKDDNPADAAAAHVKAAKVHESQAVAARKDGDPGAADQHDQAAALHRKAAGMQQATCNGATGDPQHDAIMAKLREADDDLGGPKTKEALSDSAHASRTGTAGAHRAAAASHREASEHHAEKGNKELAASHKGASMYHSKAAKAATESRKATTNQGQPMTRDQMLAKLTANCQCDKDKVALNSLSDDTLKTLVKNAESTKDDPEAAAAEKKKKAVEDGDADDDDDDMERNSFQRRKKPTVNEWLSGAPAEVQSVVRNAMEGERHAKRQIVEQLVANIQDDVRRQKKGEWLMGKSLAELRDMAELITPTANAQPTDTFPSFLGSAAPAFNAYDAPAIDPNDILPLPTMNWAEQA